MFIYELPSYSLFPNRFPPIHHTAKREKKISLKLIIRLEINTQYPPGPPHLTTLIYNFISKKDIFNNEQKLIQCVWWVLYLFFNLCNSLVCII